MFETNFDPGVGRPLALVSSENNSLCLIGAGVSSNVWVIVRYCILLRASAHPINKQNTACAQVDIILKIKIASIVQLLALLAQTFQRTTSFNFSIERPWKTKKGGILQGLIHNSSYNFLKIWRYTPSSNIWCARISLHGLKSDSRHMMCLFYWTEKFVFAWTLQDWFLWIWSNGWGHLARANRQGYCQACWCVGQWYVSHCFTRFIVAKSGIFIIVNFFRWRFIAMQKRRAAEAHAKHWVQCHSRWQRSGSKQRHHNLGH